ncbi:MAG: hypothetical protein FJ405_02640, partial [Verrucomicrobia bacterium]|nr:hypothetical protein [Verrucomicrobiota bacterium]
MARFHADLPPSSRCPVHPDAPTVVILAGGLGTRLRSVVSDRPKVLADIAGRPFLSYWLDRLSFQGFHDVILSTGHLASHVEERFGSTYGPLKLRYSVEPEALGTGGALRLASLQVSGPWVLALNGDSYCDVDLSAFYQAHQQRQARASLVVQFEPDTR